MTLKETKSQKGQAEIEKKNDAKRYCRKLIK